MNSILLFANNASSTVSNGIPFLKWLYWIFGYCMRLLMEVLDNKYFLAIVIFTVVTRLLLLPLNIRQQKTMARTTRLQPKIQKIQKKYNVQGITDARERQKMQQKLNEEMQNLYAREGHNPMQMGCGPMLFQMVFLMGIIGIIYYPLPYVLGISSFNDNAQAISDVILPIYQNLIGDPDAKVMYFQLNILENFDAYRETLMTSFPDIFTAEKCDMITIYRDSMNLFGLDMTAVPHLKGNTQGQIILIPILCLVTSLGSSVVSMIIQKKNNPAAQQQAQQMMLMMLMMPFFSFYISFKVTAAVGFYWIISNLVAILQQIFIFKQYPPRKTQARLMIDNTIERRSREENVKKIK
ncbi:MAG: YidC/Oxa1 family membrane protein insertase [Eubacterium sp.]|nr:YidC/Oxa1 family membrane protein insertase [Eubacterium sp.]